MKFRKSGPVERAGDVLSRWLQQHGRDADLRAHTIRNRWTDLVGQQLAQRTFPAALRDGLLTVVVRNAAWLNELSFMRGSIVQRINELVGQGSVRAIRLVTGRVHQPAPQQPVQQPESYVEIPPAEVQRLERELDQQQLDPDLRRAILRARLAQLGRLLRYRE